MPRSSAGLSVFHIFKTPFISWVSNLYVFSQWRRKQTSCAEKCCQNGWRWALQITQRSLPTWLILLTFLQLSGSLWDSPKFLVWDVSSVCGRISKPTIFRFFFVLFLWVFLLSALDTYWLCRYRPDRDLPCLIYFQNIWCRFYVLCWWKYRLKWGTG